MSLHLRLDFSGHISKSIHMHNRTQIMMLVVFLVSFITPAWAQNAPELMAQDATQPASFGPLGLIPPEQSQCLIEDNYPMSDVPDTPGSTGLRTFSGFRQNPFAVLAVRRNVELFSDVIKNRFSLYLQRSGRYINLMTNILKEEGIPEDIVFLALIESGFNPKAYSHMKAAGPWQFIPATGKRYGLKINSWVDERRDPVKSTRAAARYLKDLYAMFNDWELAMAAYNAGENKVKRAIGKTNSTDFWVLSLTPHLKNETKEYVPRFIAAKLIADDPGEYGFEDIQYEEGLAYDEVAIPYQLSMTAVAQAIGVDRDIIAALNPELKKQRTPPGGTYLLKLPVGSSESFLASMPTSPSAPGRDELKETKKSSRNKKTKGRTQLARKKTSSKSAASAKAKNYVIRKGDNIWSIARKTGVSTQALLETNNLRKSSRLKPGQRLQIPARS